MCWWVQGSFVLVHCGWCIVRSCVATGILVSCAATGILVYSVQGGETHRMPAGHFCKRATNYRALLRKMMYKDKASYESSPPCRYSHCGVLCSGRLAAKHSWIGQSTNEFDFDSTLVFGRSIWTTFCVLAPKRMTSVVQTAKILEQANIFELRRPCGAW